MKTTRFSCRARQACSKRELPADVYRRLEVIPAVARYHFLSRFLTMLVVIVFMHNIGIDSGGNLYTAEVATGKRVQKFRPVAAP